MKSSNLLGTTGIRVLGLVCLSLIVTAVLPQSAEASHFRYGTVSWSLTDNPGEVEYRIKVVYRRTYGFYPGNNLTNPGSLPNIGDQVRMDFTFVYGDGMQDVFPVASVTAINPAEDWFEAEIILTHQYSGSGPYTAFLQSCCRISGIFGNPSSYRLRAIVSPFGDNNSPVSNQFPIVNVAQGAGSSFFVSAADPDGDAIRFRLATFTESGINTLPPGLAINSSTGEVTWNNSSLSLSPFYAIQVIVEDLNENGTVKSRIPVDFMMKIVEVTAPPPSCTVSETGPLSALVGSNVSFDITATAGLSSLNITLQGIGLPSGTTMSPALPVSNLETVTSTFNWTPSAAQTGTFVTTFSATDQSGQQEQCGIVINVISNQPPIADAGEDQTVECPACEVQLDGSGSSDPDGDALTYTWSGPFGTASGVDPTVHLPIGVHLITLAVDDGNGETDSDSLVVTVEDTTAPELTVSGTPTVLWPPNHKYHTINIGDYIESVSDACDTNVDLTGVVITRVTSDEPEDQVGSNNGKGRNGGGGDGNTTDDIVIAGDGLTVDLRAERLGGGNGRVYTVYVGVADSSGNTSETSFQVHVPHDKKGTAIDDGMVYGYEVTGVDPLTPASSVSSLAKSGQDDGLSGDERNTDELSVPGGFRLDQNYPNPFNPSTVISYQVSEYTHVTMQVYDVTGRVVATLVDKPQSEGNYQVRFDASNLQSGVYLYRIMAGNFIEMKKMTLIK